MFSAVAAALPAWAPVVVGAVRRRLENADVAIEAGVRSSGSTIDRLVAASNDDPGKQQLSLEAVEAAARSAYNDKIRAIGQAWARGVLTDDEGKHAQERQLIQTMARVELPHVRVLGVVESSFIGVRNAATALISGWTPEMIQGQCPDYGPMLGQIIAVLRSEGLIADASINSEIGRPGEEFQVTPAGALLLSRLREAGDEAV
jgi:hypothetical protein